MTEQVDIQPRWQRIARTEARRFGVAARRATLIYLGVRLLLPDYSYQNQEMVPPAPYSSPDQGSASGGAADDSNSVAALPNCAFTVSDHNSIAYPETANMPDPFGQSPECLQH